MQQPPGPPADRGVNLIIAYKLTKGALQIIVAMVFLSRLGVALGQRMQALGQLLETHTLHAGSQRLAELVLAITYLERQRFVAIALLMDGTLAGVESWALWRGAPWGRWLVIGSTALLLPFEVVELIQRPSTGRVVLLAASVAIVIYLLRRALKR